MKRLPLSLRLAFRELRRSPITFLLTAAFLSLPTVILVVVNTVSAATGDSSWTPVAATAAAATLAVPLGLAIVVLVAANLLVAARRNERAFALLGSIGAAPATLFRIVSASGLLNGLAAAAITVVVGIPTAWAWHGSVIPVSALAVILLALLAVVFGWAASVVPALVATQVDVTRVLRAIPVPARRRWRTDRVGLVLAVVGLAAMVLGAIVSLLLQQAYAGQEQPNFWLGALGGMGASALAQFGMLLVIIGVALALPALFRMLGRLLGRISLAARLAARDAERGWNRSVSAGVTVLVTTLTIGFYLIAASASSSPAAHWWQLQEGQIAVSLIDNYYQNGVVDPRPIDNIAVVTDALRDSVELGALRTLDGVQGPFYGWPVEDNERYSGRQKMVFPQGGLPHPVLAEHDVCELGQLPAWRCETPHHYDTRFFPLSPVVPKIWVGDAADLTLILGGDVDADTLDAFERGDALVFDPRYLSADGTVTIDWAGEAFVPEDEPGEFLPAGAPLRSETIDGQLLPLEHALDYGVMLNESIAAELGLEPQVSRLLGTLTEPLLGDDQMAVMDALRDAAAPADPDYWLDITVENGPNEVGAVWRIGALLIAGGVALAVSLITVGLARLDGRATDRTLAALGAAPGIRRRISAWYALIVVGAPAVVGTVLAVVSSAISMTGVGAVAGPIPWLELGMLAVVVPLLSAAVALLAPARTK